MTGIARLRTLVHHATDQGSVRGIDNFPLFIKDADLFNALLPADGVNDIVNMVPAVKEHVELGAVFDHLTQLLSVEPDPGQIGALLGSDDEEGKYTHNGYGYTSQRNQLVTDFIFHVAFQRYNDSFSSG